MPPGSSGGAAAAQIWVESSLSDSPAGLRIFAFAIAPAVLGEPVPTGAHHPPDRGNQVRRYRNLARGSRTVNDSAKACLPRILQHLNGAALSSGQVSARGERGPSSSPSHHPRLRREQRDDLSCWSVRLAKRRGEPFLSSRKARFYFGMVWEQKPQFACGQLSVKFRQARF